MAVKIFNNLKHRPTRKRERERERKEEREREIKKGDRNKQGFINDLMI